MKLYKFVCFALLIFHLNSAFAQDGNIIDADSIKKDNIQEAVDDPNDLSSSQDDTPADGYTLLEAIDYALKKHPDIKSSQYDALYAEADIKEIKANGLPQVGASADFTYNAIQPVSIVPAVFFNPMAEEDEFAELTFGTKQNLNFGLTANQMVFNGPYLYAVRAAELYKELTQFNADISERDIRVNVTKAYYNAIVATENIEILKTNFPTLERALYETTQLYENGFAEQLDVDRLKLSISNLESNVRNLEYQSKILLDLLQFSMGMPQDEPISLSENIDDLLAQIDQEITGDGNYLNRAEYKLLSQQQSLNDLNIRSIKAGRLPTVNAFGNYSLGAQRDKFSYFNTSEPWFDQLIFGLSVNVSIFDGFRRDAQIQKAQIDDSRIQLGKKQLKQAIDLEFSNAVSNYILAKEQLDNQKQNIELAQKIYDTTLIKYKEGLGSSLEVNAAEAELINAQGLYTNALLQVLLSKIDIDKAQGLI